MKNLFTNNRFYILATSLLLALLVYVYWSIVIPVGALKTIRLVQTYALISTLYLWVTLMIGAVYGNFRIMTLRAWFFKARRALGVSAFFFGLLHGTIAFYGLLGGWAGLPFLSSNYLLSISLGFVTLVILTLLAATSFDYAVEKLGKKWKMLHRFVYLAGIFTILHALQIGSHFNDLSHMIPTVFFIGVILLLVLEVVRIDTKITTKFVQIPRFLIASILTFLIIGIYAYYAMSTSQQPLNIHETSHEKLEQSH